MPSPACQRSSVARRHSTAVAIKSYKRQRQSVEQSRPERHIVTGGIGRHRRLVVEQADEHARLAEDDGVLVAAAVAHQRCFVVTPGGVAVVLAPGALDQLQNGQCPAPVAQHRNRGQPADDVVDVHPITLRAPPSPVPGAVAEATVTVRAGRQLSHLAVNAAAPTKFCSVPVSWQDRHGRWSSLPYTWVSSGGGPLIAVPQSALSLWTGADSTDGPGEDRGDYGRACSVDGYIGLVAIGQQQALVLGDEPATTTYLPSERLFLRWAAAYDQDDLISAARQAVRDGVEWDADEDVRWVVDGPVVLFDSAWPGTKLEAATTSSWNCTRAPTESGRHAVSMAPIG